MLTSEYFDVDLMQPHVQPTEISAWWNLGGSGCHSQNNVNDTSTGVVIYKIWNIQKETKQMDSQKEFIGHTTCGLLSER